MAPNDTRSTHSLMPLNQVYLHLPEGVVRSLMILIVIPTVESPTVPLLGEVTR